MEFVSSASSQELDRSTLMMLQQSRSHFAFSRLSAHMCRVDQFVKTLAEPNRTCQDTCRISENGSPRSRQGLSASESVSGSPSQVCSFGCL